MKIKALVMPALLLCQLFYAWSCKKSGHELYLIDWGSAYVVYHVSLDQTSFAITVALINWNEVDNRITSWKLVFNSGKTQLLEVNSDNYRDYAPFVNTPTIAYLGKGLFTWQSINPANLSDSHPCKGKVFAAAAPDNMNAFVTFTDAYGKVATIDQLIRVYYSEVP